MTEQPSRGRLFVVTGVEAAGRTTIAAALAARLERAVAIDAEIFDRMVVAGRDPYDEPPTGEQLRQLYLRWSASIATAETYLLEGFEVVISDDIHGDHLEDFLDLAAPEPVRLVVLHPRLVGREELRPTSGDEPIAIALSHALVHRDTPRWGLWVGGSEQTVDETVDEILLRVDEALVLTADQTPDFS